MRVILGVAAALMLCAGQVVAEGLPSRSAVRGPEVAGTTSWTGFYIGAGIGGGAEILGLGTSGVPGTTDLGGEGAFATVVLGYDYQLGSRWVAGVFADFDLSDISGKFVGGNVARVSLDHNYSWSVGARLGTLVNPTTLLYGTVGYSQAEFEFSGTVNDSDTFEGYFAGAGIETFLRENWTLKFEYRFSNFGVTDLRNGDLGFFGGTADPSLHTARLGLSYKFGRRD
jgi:outer membrane immunogenic protein